MQINDISSLKSPVIYLGPDDDIQSIVDASPEGATFILRSGLYRNLTIEPKDFQTFVGEDGAVLSGSTDIVGWTSTNGVWSASGFPRPSFSHGEGRDGMAKYVEDLFIDDKPYVRVANLSDLKAGSFYYADGKVYITDDPTSKYTEASSTSAAFVGGNTEGVTIANLTIEKYASIAQRGAIESHDTKNWSLVDVEAKLNHGAGVSAGSGMKILGGIYSNNGQVGIHAWDTTGLVIDGVTASENNYAGFSETWDAGGIKILTSDHVTVKNSQIADNKGVGLWFDWDNKDVLVKNNLITNNDSAGLFYEASYDATISGNNISFNNKNGYTTGYWGSDLHVTSSSNVSIERNYIASDAGQGIGIEQVTRDPGSYGAHVSFNDAVTGNTIVMLTPGLNGFLSDGPKGSSWGNILWDMNTYISDNQKSLWFTWIDQGYWGAQYHSQMVIEKSGTFVYATLPDMRNELESGFLDPNRNSFSISEPDVLSESFDVTVGRPIAQKLASASEGNLSFELAQGPKHGSLILLPDGTFTYTPDAGFSGVDNFQFAATNEYKLSDTGNVAIKVGHGPATDANDIGEGPASVVLRISGDAYEGNPEFSVTIDGQKFSGLTTSASHSNGAWEEITIHGDFGPKGPQSVAVEFVNDAWGGPGMDRNLYIQSLSVNGKLYDANTAQSSAGWTNAEGAPLVTNGSVVFDTAKDPDTIVIRVSGDSYNGSADFAVTVDGQRIGGFAATASHANGEWQDIVLHGDFGSSGANTVAVAFENDAFDGPGLDRNLYIASVSINDENALLTDRGRAEDAKGAFLLAANGSVTFSVPLEVAATHFDLL
ncbi:carbohydrate-binding domain-containing protein [Bradyrhizobium liaoningense]|uniref:carbohydrate-binding domain-containing protein n=1 Tax=Bradyrhizobium liaoningense TaxID=43992 RepID=UPI001BAA73AA|nr:carbohydrate-binding domain-containing protein [Bradyrhizobium liaoningense]MBR0903878.1 right-handed parallel beta-helix repeat-containing protein [Bradyrhizobium liaoningense]